MGVQSAEAEDWLVTVRVPTLCSLSLEQSLA
jgi:hypothetical protein